MAIGSAGVRTSGRSSRNVRGRPKDAVVRRWAPSNLCPGCEPAGGPRTPCCAKWLSSALPDSAKKRRMTECNRLAQSEFAVKDGSPAGPAGFFARLQYAALEEVGLEWGVYKMIVVVEQYNAHEYSRLIDQMFQMRARVFRDRLRWNVNVVEGRERDKYDDEGPVYLIYTDERAREVKGSLRLLPTTGPTLLADIFSDTLPAGVHSVRSDYLGVY